MIVSPTHPAGPPVRSPVIASVVTLGLFFGGFGGWAALAPLSSAAIAPGTVAAQGHRRTVQHKEGGIIAELLVRDGDRVEAGQVLVRLDVTQAAARVAKLTQERAGRLAVEARLIAMQQRAEHVRYPANPPSARR